MSIISQLGGWIVQKGWVGRHNMVGGKIVHKEWVVKEAAKSHIGNPPSGCGYLTNANVSQMQILSNCKTDDQLPYLFALQMRNLDK